MRPVGAATIRARVVHEHVDASASSAASSCGSGDFPGARTRAQHTLPPAATSAKASSPTNSRHRTPSIRRSRLGLRKAGIGSPTIRTVPLFCQRRCSRTPKEPERRIRGAARANLAPPTSRCRRPSSPGGRRRRPLVAHQALGLYLMSTDCALAALSRRRRARRPQCSPQRPPRRRARRRSRPAAHGLTRDA